MRIRAGKEGEFAREREVVPRHGGGPSPDDGKDKQQTGDMGKGGVEANEVELLAVSANAGHLPEDMSVLALGLLDVPVENFRRGSGSPGIVG
eukprot:10891008-Lingulodinium_polyedra.AAC.1